MEYLKNAVFTKSIFNKKELIQDNLPTFVMVGKSNVGKSSFINALTNNKKLAKVGSNPGKTRSINYFKVNNELYLVDLPGYGFSKMSLKEKESINKLTNSFLETNLNIRHIFFLVDIRHEPTENDRAMYDWLASRNIPCTIVANKADKLSKTKAEEMINIIRKRLFADSEIIAFSSENKTGLEEIIKILEANKPI
jgi:GTP-binding protein